MFKTFGTWFMLIWAIAWFGVIVPGHTRGVVQLAPDPMALASCHDENAKAPAPVDACCMGKPKPTTSGDASKDKPRPFMGKCALCDIAAKSVTAEPFHIDLPFVGLIELLPPPAVYTLSGVQFLIDPNSRGPPQA
jgi:hypothetical protein